MSKPTTAEELWRQKGDIIAEEALKKWLYLVEYRRENNMDLDSISTITDIMNNDTFGLYNKIGRDLILPENSSASNQTTFIKVNDFKKMMKNIDYKLLNDKVSKFDLSKFGSIENKKLFIKRHEIIPTASLEEITQETPQYPVEQESIERTPQISYPSTSSTETIEEEQPSPPVQQPQQEQPSLPVQQPQQEQPSLPVQQPQQMEQDVEKAFIREQQRLLEQSHSGENPARLAQQTEFLGGNKYLVPSIVGAIISGTIPTAYEIVRDVVSHFDKEEKQAPIINIRQSQSQRQAKNIFHHHKKIIQY